jgi:UDP-N-acetylglucosamine 2-epimerase (non-hydrolysing)
MEYKKFISLLACSDLILTDSGGVQEEAAYLGRKVFILRDHLERFDGVKLGLTKIVGVNAESIESEVLNYLHNHEVTSNRTIGVNPLLKKPSEMIADYIVSSLR